MNSNTIAKHTAGPWTLHGKYPSARVIAGNFEILITAPGHGDLPSVWLANARLIAAAPKLRDCATDLLRFVDAMPDREQHKWYAVIQNMRDAIAEADGRT